MKRKRQMAFAAAAAVALAAGAIGTRTTLAQEKKGERTIELPQVEAKLPDGPGRDAVTTACVLCHSTRYITMQPAFPRETWAASVEKMRKVFGAPITNEQVPAIVDYLVSIRGTKPAAPGAGK